MASKAKKIDENTRIIDLGGGFAGSARHLARKYGCKVAVLNLSEAENERGREMNKEQGLDHLIEVIDGSFDDIPYEDETFDIVWSEDAILHSDARDQVVREAARVLKPGGEFIFTDPMQTDDCNEKELKPIYDRINLSSLGSPSFYREETKKHGLVENEFEEMPDQLTLHYYRVLQETEKSEPKLEGHVSREYIENMKKGLRNWVNGGREGQLTWGIFHFTKEA
jgi:sarcosine/dimethylglycine N-methyltransferase